MKKEQKSTVRAVDLKTRVASALTVLEQLESDLALPPPQPLTAQQRKAATRSRRGAEKVIPTIATLAQQYGVNVPLQPTAEMLSKAELASQLDPLQKKLVGLQTLVSENGGGASGDSWATATTLYSILKRISRRDVKLKKQLADVSEFFAYRSKSARENNPKPKGKKAAKAADQAEPDANAEVSAKPSDSSAGGSPNASATSGAEGASAAK